MGAGTATLITRVVAIDYEGFEWVTGSLNNACSSTGVRGTSRDSDYRIDPATSFAAVGLEVSLVNPPGCLCPADLWVKGGFAGWVKITQVGVYTHAFSGLNLQINEKP